MPTPAPAPTLQGMRAFRGVVELKSFKKAGQRLGMNGSAVSKLVAGLEAELGCSLLQRTTRRLALTQAGETFYVSVVRVLDETDAAVDLLRERGGQPQGLLRVSVPTSFGLRWLASRTPDFMVRYPALQLDLSLNDRYADLVAERFDCALRVGSELPDSSLYARRLGSVRRVLVAAPRYLKGAPPLDSPADLPAHNALTYSLAASGTLWPFVEGRKRIGVGVRGSLKVDNSVMLRETLLAGIGLALTPHFIVDDLLAQGQLLELLPSFMAAPYGVFGVTTQRHYVPLKTRVFLDFVEAGLRSSGYAGETLRSNG
jgi:DNA-binding transcriptional LysR family regulator